MPSQKPVRTFVIMSSVPAGQLTVYTLAYVESITDSPVIYLVCFSTSNQGSQELRACMKFGLSGGFGTP
jgi:hypothetical protein